MVCALPSVVDEPEDDIETEDAKADPDPTGSTEAWHTVVPRGTRTPNAPTLADYDRGRRINEDERQ